MDSVVILIIVLGVCFLAYLFYTRQLKWLLGVARNMGIGIAGILTANMLVASFGVAVGVNAITTLTIGLLGAPGFVLLYTSRMLVG